MLPKLVEDLGDGFRKFMSSQREYRGVSALKYGELDDFRMVNAGLLLRLVLGSEASALFRVEVANFNE